MSQVRTGAVPPLADGHVARPELERALIDALLPGATAALVPAGAGGRGWREACGKTQLAISYAEFLGTSGSADILVWVTATSRAAVLSTFAEAAVAASAADPGESAEARAAGFLRSLRDTTTPWLIVLDDLASPAVMEGLWPQGPAGRTLITANAAQVLPPDLKATVIAVGTFTSHESLGYVMGRLTADLDQRQGAIDLVSQLGSEPLALAQASAVIASSDLTCRGYLDDFLARQSLDAQPAALTWALAVEHADALVPDVAHPLLMFTSLLDGAGVPSTVFAEAAHRNEVPYDATQSGLSALEAAGLLAVDPAAPRLVRMNWVVQAAIRAAMPPGVLDASAAAAADALLAAWPPDGAERDEPTERAFRGCAESLSAVAGDALWASGCPAVLLRAGESLQATGLAGAAEAHWSDLAAQADRLLGVAHRDAVAIRERLGLIRLRRGEGDAVSPFRSVLNERVRVLGQDHPGTARACQHLGRALVAAGRLDEGIAVLADAAACFERSAGPDSSESVTAQEDLAAAHSRSGDRGNAITLYRRTLAIRQRVQGSLHPDTLATCRKLADAHLAEGQVKSAISLYKRVLEESTKALGAQAPDTIATRSALAAAYFTAGRMSQALQLLEQVRTEYVKTLGANHQVTLATTLTLANAYHSVGHLTDAARLLEDTVQRCEQSLPESDPLTAAARDGLAAMRGAR
jgi:tetratricopeptide (TPR) repeat protein